MKRAIAFYRNVLDLAVTEESDDWSAMNVGGLGVGPDSTDGKRTPKRAILPFKPTDIRADAKRLRDRGVKFVGGTGAYRWGSVVTFEDSEGIFLRLMKVLVVGGGGREHAIVEALRRSQADIYAAMSNHNPGIRRRSKDVLLGDVTDVERIVSWAKGHGIELAVIGPEAPLGNGITDALEAVAIPTVGPSREAAQLETNKEFTRNLMREHRIPGLPPFWAFDTLAGFEEFVNDS